MRSCAHDIRILFRLHRLTNVAKVVVADRKPSFSRVESEGKLSDGWDCSSFSLEASHDVYFTVRVRRFQEDMFTRYPDILEDEFLVVTD